jgi:hypothetical protein
LEGIKMAMMDYGSVVKKNGVIIQKEMFMEMKEAVGFEIRSIEHNYWNDGKTYNTKIEGEYFSYIGDEELLVCVCFLKNSESAGHRYAKH